MCCERKLSSPYACCRCGRVHAFTDPEGHGGLTPLEDPHGHRELCGCGRRHLSADPEGHGGLTPLEDPEGHGGLTPLEDPEGHGGLTPLEDPEGHGGLTPLEDPEGHGGLTPLEDPHSHGHSCRCCCRPCCCSSDRPFRPRRRPRCDARAAERPATVKPRGAADEYSGFIIVRLSDEIDSTVASSLPELLATDDARLQGLAALWERRELEASCQVIQSRKAVGRLRDLERLAMQSDLPPLHSLTSYWRIDLRANPEQADELVKELNALSEVDLAYRELAVSEPAAVQAADDAFAGSQGYLEPAPVGVNARWAWTQTSGDGSKAEVIDLEQGWILDHVDLVGHPPMLVHGQNRDGVGSYQGNHGTAVLGVLAGVDNQQGVVGIAPGVSRVRVASHFDGSTSLHVADAIVGVLLSEAKPPAGSVLLLEVQRSYKPTEVDDADFDAIRLASALGVIVVEAAGNGSLNLDTYRSSSGAAILRQCGPEFRDSGAIMVGAAHSALPHNRKAHSNYGSRLDCYGWGTNVVTCGYGDLDAGGSPKESYTQTFSNTSAATPVVAGAALVVQSVHRGATGGSLAPLPMRALLSNPLYGTPQGAGVAGRIGVMPDLRTLLEEGLALVPDVYLRDNVVDTGRVPRSGHTSSSPDLIVAASQVEDPPGRFGEGSGTENSLTLSQFVEPGKDRYLYARVRNRGLGTASDVTATFYWSEVSTLATPEKWQRIGTSKPQEVPQGDTLRVLGPVAWPAASTPDGGHYSLIAVIDSVEDPAPPLPGNGLTELESFVRHHNNVAWRNVQAVQPAEEASLPFRICGAAPGDGGRLFDFEVLQRLPEGAEVWLLVPGELAGSLNRGLRGEAKRQTDGSVGLRLPSRRSLPLRGIRLAAGARHRARFVVRGLESRPGHSLAIRQLHRGREVGRVTWMLGGAPE